MNFTLGHKGLFDRTLHEVLSSQEKSRSIGSYTYALLGAIALNEISGARKRADFVPRAGGRAIEVAQDSNGPIFMLIDPIAAGNRSRAVHHWIYRISTSEIIDFTLRHVEPEAKSLGYPWERPKLPSYLWHRESEVKETFGICYAQVSQLTTEVMEIFEARRTAGLSFEMWQSLQNLIQYCRTFGMISARA